jgi:hypothetical protein
MLLAVSLMAVSPAHGEEVLTLTMGASTLEISDAARPVLQYRYAPSPFKPYLRRWYTPGGRNVLRDAPYDHLHHHGMMYAIGVEGVNFWEERSASGRQEHRSLDGFTTTVREGYAVASFSQRLDWMAPGDGKARLRELRSLEVHDGQDLEASLLTWTSRLRAGPGKDSVRLDGRIYFGLGMRFVRSMDRVGTFTLAADAEQAEPHDSKQLPRSRWIAYQGKVDARAVTVAMFDHPDNPRRAAWFTMTKPFAYLSATLNLHRETLELRGESPLELRYGAALWDGHLESAAVEQMYGKWLELSGGKGRG